MVAVDYDQVLFAQPARPASRAIADFAQNPLAAHFEAKPLSRFGQFIHSRDNRVLLLWLIGFRTNSAFRPFGPVVPRWYCHS